MQNSVTSIIILSYNTLVMLQICIESIRGFTATGTYELIVVDNASHDGSVEWLKDQPDIKCIFNQENKGFPIGCNQGMEIATGSEILLLNSDVIVTPRWLEQLKIALYSSEKIGAVSCLTNKCSNMQQIPVPYNTKDIDIDGLMEFAEHFNHSDPSKWLPYYTLVGFCMLFKTSLYKEIGGLDEMFTPGNFEDDDYSIRIRMAGYQLLLCQDTFIHHFGSGSFVNPTDIVERMKKIDRYNALLERNLNIFVNKWNVSRVYKERDLDVDEIFNIVNGSSNVLLIGRYNIQDVINLMRNIGEIKWSYLTDSKFDNDITNGDFPIYYNENILAGILEVKENFDYIIVSRKIVSDYPRNSLLVAISKLVDTKRIVLQESAIV